MRDVAFVDIETTRDQSMPAYKPEDPSAFPPPPFHRVEMIGALVLRGGLVERLAVIDSGSEGETIAKFIAYVHGKTAPQVVTFNGRRFDLPVLAARAMLHGLPFAWRFGHNRYRPNEHEDIADTLSEFGAAPACSLDAWSRMTGWPGKLDASGGNVEALIAEGKRDHLRAYCMADVVLTAALWMRANLLRGTWALDQYRASAASLLAAASAEPRLAVWCGSVDKPTFLLPAVESAAA